MLLTKKFKRIFLSAVSPLCFMTSNLLGVLLHCCGREAVFLSKSWSRECFKLSIPIGGGRQYLFSNSSVAPFIKQGGDWLTPDHVFRYVDHMDDIGCLVYPLEQGFVYANLTLANIVPFLSRQMVQKIARIHKIPISSHWKFSKDDLVKLFDGHSCINCAVYTSVLEAQISPSLKKKKASAKAFQNLTKEERAERNIKKCTSRSTKEGKKKTRRFNYIYSEPSCISSSTINKRAR